MAIIKRKRGNVIYVYEQKYAGVKDGKQHYKEKVIGHLDEAGNFIPSKKMRRKKPEDFPAEIQKITTTTTKIRVTEKKENTQKKRKPVRFEDPDFERIKEEIAERVRNGEKVEGFEIDEFGNYRIIEATTTQAKDLVAGTTKLENVIFDPKKNPALYDSQNTAGDFETRIGNVKNNPINTVASIDFDKMKSLGVSISHENWLTPFDREILSVASSLYAAGNKYQSPLMIYQALSGNREDVKLTPDMRSKIIQSLKKLRLTNIEIDSSQEEKVGWNKKGHYEGALLPSERIEVMTLNGQEVVECIHFLRNSPLYEYAAGKNQISRVNIEMLNVPINNTEDNVILKCHLLRLITSMKSPKSKLKPVIRYDTLYEYLGLDENDKYIRIKKQLIRERTKEILKYWTDNGLIKGFEEESEGRGKKIVKVKILL